MYDAFFEYARKRQTALINKRAGVPKGQQSDDPIINHYKFCNVFREDDVTTIWLRENVREKMVGRAELFLATIVFRWFNRKETGDAIFVQKYQESSWTYWEIFLDTHENTGVWNTEILKEGILKHRGKGPYVTGSYCIIGMPHMSKLDGVLACIRNVCEMTSLFVEPDGSDGAQLDWQTVAKLMLDRPYHYTMECVWDWFRKFPRSGDFMAYEVVTDLQNSPGFLDQAKDRFTWANAGPGAIRGLNRIHGRPLEQQLPKKETNEEMQDIFRVAGERDDYWPNDWLMWDMRTVEHTLCEFDKYERLRLGEGRVKGVYR